ncbi:DUF6732 family protein [Rubellimicrobium sp. CFH 75288]|uniref:DUF6732 family protein n=1 Tax=Rubellimicrobium sp. CFH 75288 TaxID=2697034 RepID=UPI001411C442|nr:DUF6732 family protein [Rubellimicrobium sp. CFH 75288]NAZ37387.1 hypothetical protein [Rubellimicrobium sp. CFH 75288]
MRAILPVLLVLPAPILAHPGHVAESAGHDHWLAAGALGLAALVTAWAAGAMLRRRDRRDGRARAERRG